MSHSRPNRKEAYLDVSEYVLKEHSPLFKPLQSDHRLHEKINNSLEKSGTPEIAPIDHDAKSISMTPFLNGLLQYSEDQLFEEFLLNSEDDFALEMKMKNKSKINRFKTRKRSGSLQLFFLEHQFQDIIEEYDYQNNSAYDDLDQSSNSDENSKEQIQEQDEESLQLQQMERKNSEELQFERRSTQFTNEFRQKIQNFVIDPKKSIIHEIRLIEDQILLSDQEKKLTIKKYLEKYLLDYEFFCFEQAWKDLDLPFKKVVKIIIEGIEETFRKKIGSLSFEIRRVKLLKYLQKKKKRRWRKKVSYDCRKKVADGRLRIKGKFVTREQACELLGITDLDIYTPDELKELLEKKYEQEKER